MLNQSINTSICCFLITCCVLFLLKKNKGYKNNYFSVFLISYIVALCAFMIFPAMEFGIDGNTNKPYIEFYFREHDMARINLIPFKTIIAEITGSIPEIGAEDRIFIGIGNFIGNILLYIPIGFLLGPSLEKNNRYVSVTLFVVIMSVIIEALQFLAGRTADIDDILLHLVGAYIGKLLLFGWRRWTDGRGRNKKISAS